MSSAPLPETPADYWFRSSDGLRLYTRIYPGPSAAARTVVCLHGLLRNSRDFEDLAPHLAGRYRVIVPDIRGRGLSARDPNPENYQIAIYLRDLLELFAGLGVTSAAVVGTSMGGLIAMVMAATRPELVARIVLNDVGPEVDPIGLARIRGYAGRSKPARSWDEAVAQLQVIFGAAWPDVLPERWQQLVRRAYRVGADELLHADADPAIGDVIRNAPSAVPDLWPLWRALTGMPILVLRGENSDVLSRGTVARMKSEKPDLDLVIVRNRGHVPLLDEPEALGAIDRFLAS